MSEKTSNTEKTEKIEKTSKTEKSGNTEKYEYKTSNQLIYEAFQQILESRDDHAVLELLNKLRGILKAAVEEADEMTRNGRGIIGPEWLGTKKELIDGVFSRLLDPRYNLELDNSIREFIDMLNEDFRSLLPRGGDGKHNTVDILKEELEILDRMIGNMENGPVQGDLFANRAVDKLTKYVR